MSSSVRNSPNAKRLLLRIPEALRKTFSPRQIEAIEQGLVPRTHLIDVRCSIPLMGKGAYFVFSGGPNRRSAHRQRLEGNASPILSHIIDMSRSHTQYPNACRLLTRLPKDVAASFNLTQVQAIENALIPRKHIIDIRLSLPFLGKGAYFVFAAGPNRRSHYRDIQNKNPFTVPVVAASIAIWGLCVFGLIQLRESILFAESNPLSSQEEDFYPVAVPFKQTPGECVESGRQWINEECVDDIHDPNF